MKTDTELQRDVMEEIAWDPKLHGAEIGVAAKDGVVTLSGRVATFAQKRAAERAAQRVAGVRGVAEEVEVELLSGSERTDTELAHAALNALYWNVEVPEHEISVKVENGWITLGGAVDWNYQKRAAEESVRYLTGVKGVTDLVALRPRASNTDVKNKIEDALRRSAETEARQIDVTTTDGAVTLSGHVHSWADRRSAELAAWSAPGVREVKDLLTVAG